MPQRAERQVEPLAPTDSDTSGMSFAPLPATGTVPGGVGSLSSTWTSGRYSPQSHNRCPPPPRPAPAPGWGPMTDTLTAPRGPRWDPRLWRLCRQIMGLIYAPFLRGWVGGVKPDRRRRLTPLPASCRRGDRCKGAGLTAQVRASVRVGAESHVSLSLLAATSLVSLLSGHVTASDLHQGRGRVGAGRNLGVA